MLDVLNFSEKATTDDLRTLFSHLLPNNGWLDLFVRASCFRRHTGCVYGTVHQQKLLWEKSGQRRLTVSVTSNWNMLFHFSALGLCCLQRFEWVMWTYDNGERYVEGSGCPVKCLLESQGDLIYLLKCSLDESQFSNKKKNLYAISLFCIKWVKAIFSSIKFHLFFLL